MVNQSEYVSLVRIRKKWFYAFIVTFSTLIIISTILDLVFHWHIIGLGDTIYTRTAVLMTLIIGWFFIISNIWEGIMYGWAKVYKDKIIKEAKDEAKDEVLSALENAINKGISVETILTELRNNKAVSVTKETKNSNQLDAEVNELC